VGALAFAGAEGPASSISASAMLWDEGLGKLLQTLSGGGTQKNPKAPIDKGAG